MKVLSLNTDATRGGAAKTAITLCEAINHLPQNIEVTLFHAGPNSKSDNCISLNRTGARYINALSLRIGGDALAPDCGLADEIISKAKAFDAVHLHNLHGYYLDYEKLLAALCDTPIVWTWHDMWPLTGRCASPQTCENWKTGCPRCPNLNYYPKAWFDWANRDFINKKKAISALKNLHIVCPSRWLADNAALAGYSEERLLVVPNPSAFSISTSLGRQQARAELGLKQDERYLIFVAADCGDERKGFLDFEEIVESSGMRGIAIGEPPPLHRGSTILTGSLESATQIAKYYSAADGFVIPSYIDNYPNTVIEALSCGTPVFGYPTGGIPEQVPNKEKFISDSRTPGALTNKIVNYFDSQASYTSEYLINFARSKWAVTNVASKYADLFMEIST